MILVKPVAKHHLLVMVVGKMADEAGQKKALLDQSAHESVLSDDLYSVKTIKEDTQLKGSKYVNMPKSVHNALVVAVFPVPGRTSTSRARMRV